MKSEILDKVEILSTVNELAEKNRTVEDLKKDYLDKIEKINEASLNYLGKKDLKIFKTEVHDNWNYLIRKFASPQEYIN